ncbi:hypothetical protein [Leeia oryzae]|uniref:hypothetical protein n=1 Tax=Leeia oryzae TaxID=356662 RepID=UPI0003631A68|nr:hypothetical protein [Leeia oryzae]
MQDIDLIMENDKNKENSMGNGYLEGLETLLEFVDYLELPTKPYQVLQQWLRVEIQRIKDGKTQSRYEAEKLQLYADGKVSGKEPSRWMSPIWDKLKDFENQHAEGMLKRARGQGRKWYCLPRKQTSPGGQGHTSKFYFECFEVNQQDAEETAGSPRTKDEIDYILDTQVVPAWWARKLFTTSYKLAGWRKWLFLGYFFLNLIIIALALISAYVSSMYLSHNALEIIKWLLPTSAIAFLGWQTIKPIIQLADWRIIMAPITLFALKEDHAQLELATLSDHHSSAKREIRLVRYSAQCPKCTGKILLRDGGKQFPNRLVGRCEESPSEHVYSFDRILQIGKNLV